MIQFITSKRDFSKLMAKMHTMFNTIKELKKEDFLGSSPPSIFIGSKLKYPEVNVGILSPPAEIEEAWMYDDPAFWVQEEFTMEEIAQLRATLINSRFKSNVYEVKNTGKFLESAQEIGMAAKPVDVEIKLNKVPNIRFDFEKIALPVGPSGELKQVKILENTKIDNKVEKVVNDTDLKATEALNYLYDSGFDENTLSKLLSIGVLGLKKNRKLVPTRFSITATDDILGKQLIKKIKNYNIVNDYLLYQGNYFGNYYFILMFPEVWQYELFEGYLPRSLWNFGSEIKFAIDYESLFGRSYYAHMTSGGYYASRLPVLEHLSNLKRQASCLVIRFETPEYKIPLGVFVVRSAARKTLVNNPEKFNSKEELIDKTRNLIKVKFNYNIQSLLAQSKVIKSLDQIKLSSFFN